MSSSSQPPPPEEVPLCLRFHTDPVERLRRMAVKLELVLGELIGWYMSLQISALELKDAVAAMICVSVSCYSKNLQWPRFFHYTGSNPCLFLL